MKAEAGDGHRMSTARESAGQNLSVAGYAALWPGGRKPGLD